MTSESYQCSEFNIQIQNIGVMYYYEKIILFRSSNGVPTINNIKGKMVYVNYTFLLLHHYKIILVTLIINIFFLLLSGHDHLIIAWQPSSWWIQASMNGYTKQTCDIDTIKYIKMKSTSVWLQM